MANHWLSLQGLSEIFLSSWMHWHWGEPMPSNLYDLHTSLQMSCHIIQYQFTWSVSHSWVFDTHCGSMISWRAFMPMSSSWRTWLAWGGSTNHIILWIFANSFKGMDMWNECPSYKYYQFKGLTDCSSFGVEWYESCWKCHCLSNVWRQLNLDSGIASSKCWFGMAYNKLCLTVRPNILHVA